MNDSRKLTTEPIARLIRQITIPVSMGMFFNTMYNVVDTWFGGLISTEALAAMSLSMPVFFVIISSGSGLATGATALIGTALGADKPREAARYAVQGLSFGLLFSIILAITGLIVAPYLFRILNASDAYLEICMDYMGVLFLGAPLLITVFMLNAILNAMGETRPYRNFLALGVAANVGLDPWFIFGGLGLPAMGVKGIALATVLIHLGGAIFLGRHVHRSGLIDGWRPRDFLPDLGLFREIARQGLPAGANIMTIALGVFVITYFISDFGQAAVAAYGIGMRVEQLVLLPVIGFSTTTLTLVSQNFGAGRMDRVHETVRKVLTYGAVMMAAGTVVVVWLAPYFMRLFSDDAQVVGIGVGYLRVDAFVFYGYVILFVSVSALQGMKKPFFAIYIGIFRQIVAPYALFYLLTRIYPIGLAGIWWGILIITWTAALIALFYLRYTLRQVTDDATGALPLASRAETG